MPFDFLVAWTSIGSLGELTDFDEYLDLLVTSDEGIIHDMGKVILELGLPLPDHCRIFVRFFPEVCLGKLWQLQLKVTRPIPSALINFSGIPSTICI